MNLLNFISSTYRKLHEVSRAIMVLGISSSAVLYIVSAAGKGFLESAKNYHTAAAFCRTAAEAGGATLAALVAVAFLVDLVIKRDYPSGDDE